MPSEPTNDIDLLMSLDPLELSKQDIDAIDIIKAKRILGLATKDGECLISHYKPSKVGYPKMNATTYVHRFICSVFYGPIPKDMYVLHSCDNMRCINPKHLKVGTQRDNMKDMYDRKRQGNVGGAKPRQFTEDQHKDIISLYENGFSQREIAATYNTDQGTIWRYIHVIER